MGIFQIYNYLYGLGTTPAYLDHSFCLCHVIIRIS